jgi:hypothetical protein
VEAVNMGCSAGYTARALSGVAVVWVSTLILQRTDADSRFPVFGLFSKRSFLVSSKESSPSQYIPGCYSHPEKTTPFIAG